MPRLAGWRVRFGIGSILLTLLCGAPSCAKALRYRRFGAVTGYGASTIAAGNLTSTTTEATTTVTVSRYHGGMLGALIELPGQRFSTLFEGQLSVKGSLLSILTTANTGTHVTQTFPVERLIYLEMPVLARVLVRQFGRFDAQLIAGPSVGWLLVGQELSKKVSVRPLLRSFDPGVIVGGGLDRGGIFVQLRYEAGLRNLAVGGGLAGTGTVRNRLWSLVAGIR